MYFECVWYGNGSWCEEADQITQTESWWCARKMMIDRNIKQSKSDSDERLGLGWRSASHIKLFPFTCCHHQDTGRPYWLTTTHIQTQNSSILIFDDTLLLQHTLQLATHDDDELKWWWWLSTKQMIENTEHEKCFIKSFFNTTHKIHFFVLFHWLIFLACKWSKLRVNYTRGGTWSVKREVCEVKVLQVVGWVKGWGWGCGWV